MLRALDLLGNLNCVYYHQHLHQQHRLQAQPLERSSCLESSSTSASPTSSSVFSPNCDPIGVAVDPQINKVDNSIRSPYFSKPPSGGGMRTRSQAKVEGQSIGQAGRKKTTSSPESRSQKPRESEAVSESDIEDGPGSRFGLLRKGLPISPPSTPLNANAINSNSNIRTSDTKLKKRKHVSDDTDSGPDDSSSKGRGRPRSCDADTIECKPPTPESLPRQIRTRIRRSERKSSIGTGDTAQVGEKDRDRHKSGQQVVVEIPLTPSNPPRGGKKSDPAKNKEVEDTEDSSGDALDAETRTIKNKKKKKANPKEKELKKPGHGHGHGLVAGNGNGNDNASESAGANMGESGAEVLAKSEKGIMESVGKIHLIQERLRYDPWKMLVATSLLNKTTGRAARPVLEVLLRRWPSANELAEASIPDLSELLYPLGLFNQRASSLVRFSRQYLDLNWPIYASSSHPLSTSDLPPLPNPNSRLNPNLNPISVETPDLDSEFSSSGSLALALALDVKVFHGSGVYASDSFRIFSHLLPGRGGPENESIWLEKRARALEGMREHGVEWNGGVEMLGDWLGDDGEEKSSGGDEEEEEWRKVRPNDKELRRYLIWRWGIEGIVYDIHTGPKIVRDKDKARLSYLLLASQPNSCSSASVSEERVTPKRGKRGKKIKS
ncbi:hypothetical protein IAT40_006265 [Kwoniella sp. CBS 6097]